MVKNIAGNRCHDGDRKLPKISPAGVLGVSEFVKIDRGTWEARIPLQGQM